MSGDSRLKVSLRREIELWQRPPVTAIRVLKFCRARSFCEGKHRMKSRVKKKLASRQPNQIVGHLSHMDELGEDLGSLLSCVSAEDHQLDPLGHAVTHHDRPFQGRIFSHRALHDVAAVVQELANRIAEVRHRTAWILRSSVARTYWNATEVLELQVAQVFSHLIWLHAVEDQRHLPLLHRGGRGPVDIHMRASR